MSSRLVAFTGSLLLLAGVGAADQVYFDSTAYGNGDLGEVPSQNFTSASDLMAPIFNIKGYQPDRLMEGYLMFSWAGSDVPRPAPVIFDSDGTLVWIHPNEIISSDFKMQNYQGEKVLTYFDGDYLTGYGEGTYSIMNASYDVIREVGYVFEGMGEQPIADLHDFIITNNDTFLLVSWGYPVQTDLSAIGGPEDGWAFDCLFQEVDFDGNVVFNFSSLEQGISVSETLFGTSDDISAENRKSFRHSNALHYGLLTSAKHMTVGAPDLRSVIGHLIALELIDCHINSVEKDDDGSYLVSMRGPSTVYKIGQDGKVAWRLAYNDDMSDFDVDDNAKFAFQHDARWLNDSSTNPRYMSLFDNHGLDGFDANDVARGIILEVDTDAMTVKLVAEYPSSTGVYAGAQGNLQVQPNGNALVGYGFQSHSAEFTASGELLYDAFHGPDDSNERTVLAYRTFKFDWVGLPHTQPDFVIDGSDEDARAFVSWNGATEVATWMFAVGDDASSLKSSTKFARTGFESNSTLPDDSASHIAVVALDSDGGCLGVSKAISIEGSEDPQDCNCEAIEGLDAADTPDTGSKDDEDEDDDSSAGITQMDTLAVVAFALVGLLVI